MTSNTDNYWFKKSPKELAPALFSYVTTLRRNQSYREADDVRHMRLYGNLEAYSLQQLSALRAEPVAANLNRITLNVVQSMVDTVVSKITKNKPKPTFLTEGGDWSMQRKAQKLTQFVEGQYQATEFYSKAAIAFQDSCILGTGALKFFKKDGEIAVERTFITELTVDDYESIYGEPRSLFQDKWIHKDILKAKFPEHERMIEMAASEDTVSSWASNTYNRASDMLLVREAWHLKSGKEAEDGKHVIAIRNAVLFEEQYDKDYFPFVFWRWNVRPVGFWGQGLAEQLTGLQLEINKILRTIQISMHLVSVPKLLVEASSKVVSAHLNNKIGGIIKYAGTPPTYAALGSIPPELFAHLDRLYNRAYEIAGVSQLSATSQKPAGLNSGKALREYNDLETERFMAVAQRNEKCFIDAAAIMIDLAKELDEELEDGYQVKVKGSKSFQTIKWNEINLERDQYVMHCFPTTALSSTPAAKLQDVQELLEAGFISKEDGMKLLDFPDLRQFYNFNNAGVEDIERAIELIIDNSDYQTPEPYQNLELGIVKMQQAYLYYRAQGAPETKLELFRRWIADADALIRKAQEAMQPPAPPPAPEPPLETLPQEVAAEIPPEMLPADPSMLPVA